MLSFLASLASRRTTPARSARSIVIERGNEGELPGWATRLLAELGE